MNLSFDTVIAGSGLAGACAAFELSADQRVLVLDRDGPGAGASGTAIGLVSPLMARRARPVWRMQEAVDALDRMLDMSGSEHLFRRSGVLKPALSPEQATEFRDAALRWPAHGQWHDPETAGSRWPGVSSGNGLLEVASGGSVEMPALCEQLVRTAVERGARFQSRARIRDWTETDSEVRVDVDWPDEGLIQIRANRLLLALGAGYLDFPELTALHLHPIKGQWVRLNADQDGNPFIPISSRRFIAATPEHFIVGSTYEHDYPHTEPTEQATASLIQDAAGLYPALATARVVDAYAAIRVTVPGIRLPMLGPLPGKKRVWIFTGLGSKGLLMAPLLAGELPEFFTNRKDIPKEIRVS